VLKYEDDEGDMITVGSSTELHDATVVFPNNLTLEVIAYPGLQSPSSGSWAKDEKVCVLKFF